MIPEYLNDDCKDVWSDLCINFPVRWNLETIYKEIPVWNSDIRVARAMLDKMEETKAYSIESLRTVARLLAPYYDEPKFSQKIMSGDGNVK